MDDYNINEYIETPEDTNESTDKHDVENKSENNNYSGVNFLIFRVIVAVTVLLFFIVTKFFFADFFGDIKYCYKEYFGVNITASSMLQND